MKLGVNGWRIHGRRTGVGRYLLNVVKHWGAELVSGRFEEINFYSPREVDRNEIAVPENIRLRVLRPHWRMIVWENLRLGPAATDDVLFCPSYSRPLVSHGKTVVTTHEATLKLHPKLYPLAGRLFYARLYAWSARQATLVITHTEAARRDIARCYGVPLSRIRVVPLAPAEIFMPLGADPAVAAARERYLGSDFPFFLYVGKLTARRNLPKLLEAFARLKQTTSLPHKLVVIGLRSINLDIAGLAARLGISPHVVHREYIPDEELNLLFNAAEAFVLPYTYEAVSLTALEAQATGTPVITVDTPGLRETTGGRALFMAKAEVPDIAQAMARLAGDPILRRELAESGLQHARSGQPVQCGTCGRILFIS